MHARTVLLGTVLVAAATAVGIAQSAPDPQPAPRTPRAARPAPAPGDQGPAQASPRPTMMRQRMQQELGLTDAQMAELQKLRSEQQKRTIRSAADRRIARMELEELLNADTPDQKAIDVKVKQLADLEAGKLRARVDQQLAMRKVLTPEQFKKWQQLRPARGERAAARRLMRDGRPGRWNRAPRGRGWGQPEAPMAPAPPRPPGDPGEPR